jgi:hypothetical protein
VGEVTLPSSFSKGSMLKGILVDAQENVIFAIVAPRQLSSAGWLWCSILLFSESPLERVVSAGAGYVRSPSIC